MTALRSKWLWLTGTALGFGLVVLSAYLLSPTERLYQGQPLDYWLEGYTPTQFGRESKGYRTVAAVQEAIQIREARHQVATLVLRTAGSNCVPALLERLTAPPKPKKSVSPLGFQLRSWAYRLRLIDDVLPGPSIVEVRRGQALSAIIELKEGAATAIPELSRIAAQDRDDDAWRAASYALWKLAPDEFRRVRSPEYHNARQRQDAKPEPAVNR